MPQADTARSQLFFLDEDLSGSGDWGVTPSAAMTEMRFTGESLKHDKGTAQSAEIRSDRQVPDIVEVSAGASGDVNFELSYGAYDAFLEGALQDEWTVASNQQSTTFVAATKKITGTGVDTNIVIGQWVRVRGSTSNDGFYEVVAKATDEITVREVIADEGPTADVYVEGTYLRNGTIEKAFTMEKLFSDLTAGQYTNFTGMEIAQLGLNIVADQMVTGTLSFLGKEGVNQDTTVGTGGPNPAATNDVINATANVGVIKEGDTPADLSTALQAVNFTINNNLRARRAIANRAAIGIGQGRCVVTGNVNAYFEDGALYQKMIGHDASYLSVRLHDGDISGGPEDANSIFITFHKIKFTGGDPLAGAADQDVMANLSFQAVRDPTTGIGCTIQIDKFAKV